MRYSRLVTLSSIEKLYTALYNTDLPPDEFAVEFFFMVGEILNGKRLDELKPSGPAAETLKELLTDNRSNRTGG